MLSNQYEKNREELLDCLYKLSEIVDRQAMQSSTSFSRLVSLLTELEHIPYSVITMFMFNEDNERIRSEFSKLLLAASEDYVYESDPQKTNFHQKLIKVVDHMELASAQKADLHDDQSEIISELNTKLKNANTTIESYRDQIDKLEKRSKKLMVDFISILGIFSTVIFAVFGGLTQFSSLGGTLQVIPIHKVLMYLSLNAILLIVIIFISFNAISRLTGMHLKSCCDESTCEHKLSERHPSLLVSQLFFGYLFLFSIILRIINYTNLQNISPQLTGWFAVISSCIIAVLFIVTSVCVIKKFSKSV